VCQLAESRIACHLGIFTNQVQQDTNAVGKMSVPLYPTVTRTINFFEAPQYDILTQFGHNRSDLLAHRATLTAKIRALKKHLHFEARFLHQLHANVIHESLETFSTSHKIRLAIYFNHHTYATITVGI